MNAPTPSHILCHQYLHRLSAELYRANTRIDRLYLKAGFNPSQPRVPSGNSDGGQWTERGGGSRSGREGTRISSDKVPRASPKPPEDNRLERDHSENNTRRRVSSSALSYPDGKPIIDPNTGKPYPAPPTMDMGKNLRFARAFAQTGAMRAEKDIVMVYSFFMGQPQDYQRPNGYLAARRGDFIGDYRNVTNYNYGAVAAAMGYDLEDALKAAGTYNRLFGKPKLGDTGYGIQQDAVNNITHGFHDYHRGRLPSSLP